MTSSALSYHKVIVWILTGRLHSSGISLVSRIGYPCRHWLADWLCISSLFGSISICTCTKVPSHTMLCHAMHEGECIPERMIIRISVCMYSVCPKKANQSINQPTNQPTNRTNNQNNQPNLFQQTKTNSQRYIKKKKKQSKAKHPSYAA